MKRWRRSVSAMTGTIINRMRTDMVHHCGPRVAFCAATRTGMVWALAFERKSARRYSFQARMKTRSDVATRPARASGRTMPKKMRKRDAPSSEALSSRSFGNGHEEVVHQPDDDRQVDRRIGRDERGARVEKAELLEHHIDRDGGNDRRQDALGDDPEQDIGIAEPDIAEPGGGAREQGEQERAPRQRRRDAPVDTRRDGADHREHQEDEDRRWPPSEGLKSMRESA